MRMSTARSVLPHLRRHYNVGRPVDSKLSVDAPSSGPIFAGITALHASSTPSTPTSSATSSLALIIPGGTCTENPDQIGASHIVKHFLFGNTKSNTGIKLLREADLRGLALSTVVTREYIALATECVEEEVDFAVELMTDVALYTQFNDWRLSDAKKEAYNETRAAFTNLRTELIERIHRVAFRQNGLGNSLFAHPDTTTATFPSLTTFVENSYSKYRPVFAGVGVSNVSDLHNKVNEAFGSAVDSRPNFTPSADQYYGGERRFDQVSRNGAIISYPFDTGATNVALAAVLRHLLGSGEEFVRYGDGVSPIRKVAASSGDVSLASFYLPYTLRGLFGISAEGTQPENVSKGFLAGVDALKAVGKGTGAGEQEVKRAIRQAQAEVVAHFERPINTALSIAGEIGSTGKAEVSQSLFETISKVTGTEVSKFAKSLLAQKPSYVVVGQEAQLPQWEDIAA